MDTGLNDINTLTNFVQSFFVPLFDAMELFADYLLNRLPHIFGLSMGMWLLAAMFLTIILGGFVK